MSTERVEDRLKAAYVAWREAKRSGDQDVADAAGDAYASLIAEEFSDGETCVYRGDVWYEHDYDEVECRRCGAEAPYEDEVDA